jgi:hypothetical protein
MYEGAIASRWASSAMVAYSPDSSSRFQRNARSSALTSVLSTLRWAGAPDHADIDAVEAQTAKDDLPGIVLSKKPDLRRGRALASVDT